MRFFSALILAAATAVPLATALTTSDATAQVSDRGSVAVGNYGYRDSSGMRSRGEGRNLGVNRRTHGGIVAGHHARGTSVYGHGHSARGYGYNDRGNYGYRSYSGYRPNTYSYRSTGHQSHGYSSHRHNRRVGYSYGYAPIGYGYAPSYGYSSYGYRPAVSVAVGFGGYSQPARRYGYGSWTTGYGYNSVNEHCD